MLWEFRSAATDGLRVIPVIPDITPCLLEGRNGIGKTVAVQLIQLASGEVPSEYITHPERWESLRERLGATSLSVSGLADGVSIAIEFSPQNWPSSPQGLDVESLGSASINGGRATMADAAALLKVDRISGNEDLAESVERHRKVLESQLRAMGQVLAARNASVTALVRDVLPDLERLRPAEFEAQLATLTTRERAVVEARGHATRIASQLSQAVHLNELIRKRGARLGQGDELLAKRDAAAEEVRRLETLLGVSKTRADELARVLRKQGGVAERLADASSLVRSRTEREAGFARGVSEASRKLGVAAEPSLISSALDDCNRRLDEIDSELRRLDLTGQLKILIDNLSGPLTRADPSLGDQVLGAGFTPALTVSAASSSIAERRHAIRKEPTPEQVRQLKGEQALIRVRLAQLGALAEQVSRLARARELLSTAEMEYSALEKHAAAVTKGVDASREADSEVGRVQQELTSAHAELAALSQALAAQGTLSSADAEREIQQLLGELGISENEANAIEEGLRRDSVEADRSVETSQELLTAARHHEMTLRADLNDLVGRLDTQPWFERAAGGSLRLPNGEPDLKRYWSARTAVLTSLARIQKASDRIASLEGLCREFLKSGRDPGSGLDDRTRQFTPAFTQLFSARILDALRSPSIKRRLFDEAEPVGLDAVHRTLILRRPDGAVERRPLSSYSTGEQAYAFTQARILDLEPSVKPNRLLVLDEFGAFVSADRIPELAEFLASGIVRDQVGQVVVILPLQVDYEAEIGNTLGDLRTRYEDRLGQIQSRGYCAVELT